MLRLAMEQGADYVDIELQVFNVNPSKAVPLALWLYRKFFLQVMDLIRG